MTTDPTPELASVVADRLGQIEGVIAVVLGGSHATGTANPDSDIDLGIYYDPAKPPPIDQLRSLARELDDRHADDLVTNFGEWGQWINGGGWLEIRGVHVDWLYRDLGKVAHEIDECNAGRPVCHYQPGHPLGFYNHIYMGEIAVCHPLVEHGDRISSLKARTTPYPSLLKKAMIARLWEAGFSLSNSYKPAARADVFTVTGYCYRAVGVMVQSLFALNEQYCLNEKGSVHRVAAFPFCPPEFEATVSSVLAAPGRTPDDLMNSVTRLESLLAEVEKMSV